MYRLIIVLIFLITYCCAYPEVTDREIQRKKNPIKKESSPSSSLSSEPKHINDQAVSIMELSTIPEIIPVPEIKDKDIFKKKKEEPLKIEKKGEKELAEKTSPLSTQEIIDSALNLIEKANDQWEKGEINGALKSLDRAYETIVKISDSSEPEILQQKEDIRYTIAKRIMEVYSSRFTVVNGNHSAIPLVMNRYVKKAIKLFTGKEKEWFLRAYRRSGRYRPMIIRKLKEAGLPQELSWLPLIESGFSVEALSRARALGLWQFVASTGYKFGLKRNRWIDERMDPEKSTDAAISYLKELHNIFGDWTTVLAAYNCGELRVLNAIRRQRINYLDNFWDLYEALPQETAFYVPKFLAVLHILKDPKRYRIELPSVDAELVGERVTINKRCHLKAIAKAIGVDYRMLKELNPELRHAITPDEPYNLKVPVGKGELLLSKIEQLPEWSFPEPSYIVYRVKHGDTLSEIAKRYHTSVRRIMLANALKSRNYLRVGWKLKIPTGSKAYKRISSKPSYKKSSIRTFTYVVKKGDSLWKIARRFGTTTEAIKTLNGLKSNMLSVGQVLKIYSKRVSLSRRLRPYITRSGDNPYIIAKRFGMSLREFLSVNNLSKKSIIYPGQKFWVFEKRP